MPAQFILGTGMMIAHLCSFTIRCRFSISSCLAILVSCSVGLAQESCDVLLKSGTIYDGSGEPSFVSDIAITGTKIVAIGPTLAMEAKQSIDCRGLVISPGFIDIHSHSDDPILERNTRANMNFLLQGCTLVVTGNCGSGPVDAGAYFEKLERLRPGTNIAHLLPHGRLRSQVMGSDDREPTDEELAKMKSLAEKAMKDGVVGMSTGLIYVPGNFSKTDELIEIAKIVGKYGGIYVSHIRGEGTTLLEAVDEAIRIGREANLPAHISHFKASGKKAWGSLHVAAMKVEEARKSGQIVTADQYPYIASSTSLQATLLPKWVRSGGSKALLERLNDPETSARLRKELVEDLKDVTQIFIASYTKNPKWNGMSLEQIATAEKKELVDVVMEIERNGGASIVNFGMDESDVRQAMTLPWVATASDGSARNPSASQIHPRSFGTFPRKIGRYAIEEKVVSLEAAIRSATSLPAQIIGLDDRGLLKTGKIADITIFDPATFRDQATFDHPYLPPTGLKYVLIGGEFAVYGGQPTGAMLGKPIRRKSDSK